MPRNIDFNETHIAISSLMYGDDESQYNQAIHDALDKLNNQPTADVKEVVRGENISELNPVDGFECSKCGIMLEGWTRVEIDEHDMDKSHCEYYFDFCPNCGADMREVKQYD